MSITDTFTSLFFGTLGQVDPGSVLEFCRQRRKRNGIKEIITENNNRKGSRRIKIKHASKLRSRCPI